MRGIVRTSGVFLTGALVLVFWFWPIPLVISLGSVPFPSPDTEDLGKFLGNHCQRCHAAMKPKAGFRVDELLPVAITGTNLASWKEILGRIESRDMPPRGQPRPAEAEYEAAAKVLRKHLEKIEDEIAARAPRMLRRLNRAEYVNTIRDLFGIRYRPGDDFPIDGTLHGFDTVADGLTLSAALVEKYLACANAVLDRAIQPVDPGHQPKRIQAAFYDEHYTYPKGTPLNGLNVYNGNAHLTFGPEGKKRLVYIGGPALFSYAHIDPIHNPVHAANSEGVYRLLVRLTPQRFEPGEVVSFTILGTEKRRIAEVDVPIKENGKPLTLQAESYYDRSESTLGFEINWTNGNHLQDLSRGRLRNLPFDGSDQNKPWWHINYRMVNGKRVEWKPNTPEELPFSYFEKVEFTIVGPVRDRPKETAELLGSYEKDQDPTPVLERFLPRAFRRPVSPNEVRRFVSLVKKQKEKGLDPTESLKVGMAAALCSPHFLFLVETPPKTSPRGGHTLNPQELASRLSYFLWSSCPDAELTQLANTGKLLEKEVLAKQVKRMINDPKSEAFVDRFARQWLNLDKLNSVMPEPKLFPKWSEDLRDGCRAETIAFFREVLKANRPVTDFLASDWTYVNEDLAEHYGLSPAPGRTLRKVKLSDDRRGGLLTQASLLTLTSEATRTAPVIRGAYVLDRLFNRPPPPPPPNVGALIPDASQAKSVRDHLAIHRSDPSCAGCHSRFDPYGLALEQFDATGRWRLEEVAHEDPAKPVPRKDGETIPTFKIDARVELADGTKLEGVPGLKKHLILRKREFIRGLAERLTIYACGRGLTFADRSGLEAAVKATEADGDSFQSLIQAVVESPAFRTR